MSETASFGYLKASLLALIICAGIAGGLAIGFSIKPGTEGSQPRTHVPSTSTPISWTNFGPGDAFPHESFVDAKGDAGSFELLLKDHESIVLFVDWTCDACLDLLRYVQTDMLNRLSDGCRVVVITDVAEGRPPPEYSGLVKNTDWVTVNGDYWRSTYHTVMRPIIVGVDNSGIVLHVQFGYGEFLDHEIVGRFFKKN